MPPAPARALGRARPFVGAACIVLTGALMTGCTGSSSANRSGANSSSAPATTATNESSAATGANAFGPVSQVATQLGPSVVTVLVSGGNGSGVIYNRDGLILTNEHVVRGHRQVQIEFADGRRFPGTVTATDAVTDLALVRVDRTNLPAAKFDTALPQVGSLAVVLGSPLGFQNTVTAGVISGLHREIPGSASQGESLVDLIQTDAPISPGNSGGAVANASGQVIGISEAYIPPQAGAVALGFAIPAATAVDIAQQLEKNGRAEHAFTGLIPAAITPEIASQLGLSSTDGVIVADVDSGGPAARAGLTPGDIIVDVDGKATRSPEDFLAAIRPRAAGDVVTLEIRRAGQGERSVKLTLSARPG